MKKFIVILLSSILLFFGTSSFQLNHASAASKTLKWGKINYQVNYIGKIVIKAKTTTYKIKKGKLISYKTLKKGTEAGVTSTTSKFGGLYEVGKGIFVKKSKYVKYDAISKSPSTDSKFEKGFIEEINKERKKKGLSPLKVNSKLSQLAKIRTADLVLNKFISHDSKQLGKSGEFLKNYGVKNIRYMSILDDGKDTLVASPQKTLQNHLKYEGAKNIYLSYLYDEIGVGYINHPKLGSKLYLYVIQTKQKADPNLVPITTYKKLPKVNYAYVDPRNVMNTYSMNVELKWDNRSTLLNGKAKYIAYTHSTSPIKTFDKREFSWASSLNNISGFQFTDAKQSKFYVFIVYLDKDRKAIGYEEESYTSKKINPQLATNYKAFSTFESIGITEDKSDSQIGITSDREQGNYPYKYFSIHFTDKKLPLKELLTKETEDLIPFGEGYGQGISPTSRFKNTAKFYITVIVYDQSFKAVGSYTKEYLVNNFK
jgi:uncharacterized protein YkwD